MSSHAKRNWSKYNKSLINRGSINIWIEEAVQKEWVSKQKKRGRPAFSTNVIEIGWILKIVYRLSLRALQGFLESVLNFLKLSLKVPNYTLFSKRAHELSHIPKKLSCRRPTDLVIDASGVKVYGEGEWKVKIHGASKHRKWLKLHVGMDPVSQEVISIEVTDGNVADSKMLKSLVEKAPKSVQKVIADGAYDRKGCRDFLQEKSIQAHIPPAVNARPKPGEEEKNNSIEIIQGLGGGKEGKSLWKKLTGYHIRSLVETVFSRLKRLFGDRLKCRKVENQKVEANLSFYVLNRMVRLSNVN
jgi:hypothetical protein